MRFSRTPRSPPNRKAFGLNRAASVTSLDIDRTFWIRVRLLHFAPWISHMEKFRNLGFQKEGFIRFV